MGEDALTAAHGWGVAALRTPAQGLIDRVLNAKNSDNRVKKSKV